MTDYKRDPLDVLLKIILDSKLKATELERQIILAFMMGESDAALALRIGEKRHSITRKRQNIYAKIGYQILQYQRFKHLESTRNT
jgi:DNA-binding CsgD family transcriptional regulator